jgi:hypothetical protein
VTEIPVGSAGMVPTKVIPLQAPKDNFGLRAKSNLKSHDLNGLRVSRLSHTLARNDPGSRFALVTMPAAGTPEHLCGRKFDMEVLAAHD